jgi:hypothetical protein
MNGAKRSILCAVALSAITLAAQGRAHPAPAHDGDVVSGDYDGMLIGFNSATRIVTGYFDEYIGGKPGPTFSCIFYLTGKFNGSSARISTYFPDAPAGDLIKGELVLETRLKFKVRLPEEHGGCEQVGHFADDDRPAEFTLRTRHPWNSIAVVKSAKAHFFDAPASGTHRKAYVVKGDGVGVRASQPGWLQVDYVDGQKVVSGWIRQSDVYPAN